MVNGVNNTTVSLSTNLQKIIADGKVTKEEAANLSADDLKAIREADASVQIEDGVEEAVAANGTNTETTDVNSNSNVDVEMPDETIDEAATAQLKAEITEIREDYAAAKAEAEELADKIDKKEDEYEALQYQLKGAVSKVEDAAINASEEVSIEVNKIRQQAQEEGWSESKLKARLSAIGIPSISSEQRNLESIGCDVSSIAKVITELSDLYASQADTVDLLAERWGGFLEVDLNTISVDLTGKIVVNEAGSGGPEVSGADGVSTLDMQKFANMTNTELTEYMSSDAGKDLLTAMQGMANEGVNLSAENCAAILKTMIAEQDKSTGDVAKFGTQYKDNLQVNQVNGASKEELEAAVKKVNKKEEVKKSCDPYIINIDGVEYTMILDNNDGKWDTNDILGINDNKDNLFEALKGLESDGDKSNLTGDELAKAGIRLVAKNDDGTLAVDDKSKDFDLSKIDNIDMTNLTRSTDNDGNVGTFGNFNLTLTDGRTIQGAETFEEKSTLQKLFGAVKDFFTNLGNVASDIIEKLKMDKDEKEWYSEGIKAKVAMVTKNTDSTVDDMIYSSDELLDESLRSAKNNATDGYKAPETQQQPQPTDIDNLSEEEKRKLAEQQLKRA